MGYLLFFKEGSKVTQLLCAILCNLSVVAYGMSIGWMSPTTLLLQSEQSPIGRIVPDSEISLMASMSYIISIPSTTLFVYLGDNYGRKPSLILMSLSFAAHWALLLVSSASWVFILARAITGTGMAAAYIACPLYTKEISQDSIRGALGSLVIVSQTTGNLISYVIGDLLSYETVLWVSLAVPVIHIILFCFMPESPSFLVKKGKEEEAVRAIAWLRCRRVDDPSVQSEVDVIKKEQLLDSESSQFALKAIWQNKILMKAFWIAMVVTQARELCGCNIVLNFAATIFDISGASNTLTPNQQAMVLGLVQVIGALVASSLVENTGRKPLLIATALISGLGMCTLATWFLLSGMNIPVPAWLPITALCLCIFCDSAGLQPISIVVMNEIFSFKYRSTVSAITMGSASVADFILLLFFKPLASMIGAHVSFYFFGVVCLLSTVYIVINLPETKMKTIEEIYEKLGRKLPKKDKNNTEI